MGWVHPFRAMSGYIQLFKQKNGFSDLIVVIVVEVAPDEGLLVLWLGVGRGLAARVGFLGHLGRDLD